MAHTVKQQAGFDKTLWTKPTILLAYQLPENRDVQCYKDQQTGYDIEIIVQQAGEDPPTSMEKTHEGTC